MLRARIASTVVSALVAGSVLVTCFMALTGCALESMATGSVANPPAESVDESTLEIELDVLADVVIDSRSLDRAIAVATASLKTADVSVSFLVNREDIRPREATLTDGNEKSTIMERTRDDERAIHVVMAARGAGAHGVAHYSRDPAASPRQAGLFVFAESVSSDFSTNGLLADAGLHIGQLLGRTIAHEVGHALGCPHPAAKNGTTVMVQNSVLGAVTRKSLERWRAALEGDGRGYPHFADAARACLDPSKRLSIELARPAYDQ